MLLFFCRRLNLFICPDKCIFLSGLSSGQSLCFDTLKLSVFSNRFKHIVYSLLCLLYRYIYVNFNMSSNGCRNLKRSFNPFCMRERDKQCKGDILKVFSNTVQIVSAENELLRWFKRTDYNLKTKWILLMVMVYVKKMTINMELFSFKI